jgi:hypothetical protein
VLKLLQLLERGPFAFVPKGFLLQPIDVREVTSRLVELALSAPARHVPDEGGPEIRTFADLARSSLEVSGRRRRVVEIPLPGRRRELFPRGRTCVTTGSMARSRGKSFCARRYIRRSTDTGGGVFMDGETHYRRTDRESVPLPLYHRQKLVIHLLFLLPLAKNTEDYTLAPNHRAS